jgi:hypothetical protein
MNTVMPASPQFHLDERQPSPHPFSNRASLHLKLSLLVSPTDVRQSQKIECLGWSLASAAPLFRSKSTKLD